MNRLDWIDTFRGQTWMEVLQRWEKGDIPSIPFPISKPFIWRTSCLTKGLSEFYREELIEDRRLKGLKQNYEPFIEKFDLTSKKKHCVAKPNLGKDSILVVPTLEKSKEFTNLFFFIKNASLEKQKAFWKQVAKEVKKRLKTHDRIWVNSPNLGVHYLHVRIDTKPKYYEDSELKKTTDNKKVIALYNKYLKEKL